MISNRIIFIFNYLVYYKLVSEMEYTKKRNKVIIFIKLKKKYKYIIYNIVKEFLVIDALIMDKDEYILMCINNTNVVNRIINKINGHIYIKCDTFKKVCKHIDIDYIEPKDKPIFTKYDEYLSGLIDIYGSINYHYKENSIDLTIKIPYYEVAESFDYHLFFDKYKPKYYIYWLHIDGDLTKPKIKYFIIKYTGIKHIMELYMFANTTKLYNTEITNFIQLLPKYLSIRTYRKESYDSNEYFQFIDCIKDLYLASGKTDINNYLYKVEIQKSKERLRENKKSK